MNILLVVYGVYFMLVDYRGNGQKLLTQLGLDVKGFFPWIVSIIILSILYNNEKTRPIVRPFIVLAVITFTLTNFPKLKNSMSNLPKTTKV